MIPTAAPGNAAQTTVSNPGPKTARGQRIIAPSATIVALTVATLGLRLRDPHQQGSWGFCPFNLATGLECPGCDGLRAVYELTRGDLPAALSSNLVVTLLAPIAAVVLTLWVWDRWRGQQRRTPARVRLPALMAFLVAVAAFTIARNLPVGAWLAP